MDSHRVLPIALVLVFLGITNAGAQLFGPSQLDRCRNDLEAEKLRTKYCYREKVNTERELEKARAEFTNQKGLLDSKINTLNRNIDELNSRLDQSRRESDEQKKSDSETIAGLKKTVEILKQQGSSREKELLDEISRTRKTSDDALAKMREELKAERDRCISERDALRKKHDAETEKLTATIANLNAELDSLKKLTRQQKDELDRMKSQEKELQEKLEREIKDGNIRLKKFHDRLVINLDDRISFPSGSAELKREILPALKKIAAILASYPENRIMIEGHTDNLPIKTFQFPDNWSLSTARALSVLRLILENSALDAGRFGAAGYGEHQPLVPNTSPENRSMNRRVDIVVLPRTPK